jgi:hypothetical protein
MLKIEENMLSNTIEDSRFNPNWRDDVFDEDALKFSLTFPEDSAPNNKIWVSSKFAQREILFDQEYRHASPRKITAIVKRSDLIGSHVLRDHSGNELPQDSEFYNYIFPPKAWMSDTLQERCMMFAAAKQASGNVLVGGLGLAVYPQLIFQLKRPVNSITIIESSAEVIELLQKGWIDKLDAATKDRIRIIQTTIESYLQTTTEQFDTIYLDTWEDADSRYLPFINYLVQLALPKCSLTGKIQCWGYALMVDTFVKNAVLYVNEKVPLDDFRLDPALEKYAQWFNENQAASDEEIEIKAREIALTVSQAMEGYDKNSCFTPYSTSIAQGYLDMARARK